MVLVAVLAGIAGIAWYYSGEVLVVRHSTTYPIEIKAVEGDRVALTRNERTERAGVDGLAWRDGYARVGPPERIEADRVIRRVEAVKRGSLRAGERAYLDAWVYDGDPKAALGLDVRDVRVRSDGVGELPAWHLPAAGTTWVIALHGRGASRDEALRVMPTLHRLGLPVLSVTYRNGKDAPRSPDGLYHLGDTEARDAAAAVGWARERGATGVVLYGWSMGGEVALTALRRSGDWGVPVRGVVLDAPVMDWGATLDKQGAQRGLPSVLTGVAKSAVEIRASLSLRELDQRRYAPLWSIPMLVYADRDDDTVANEPTVAIARSHPGRVRLVETTGGGHTRSWNVDPGRYETALSGFLGSL